MKINKVHTEYKFTRIMRLLGTPKLYNDYNIDYLMKSPAKIRNYRIILLL